MRKLLLSLLLLLPSAAFAQSVRYQSQAISSRGAGIANATIAVCTQPANTNTQPCSPLATLATSTSTTSGGANPLTADSFGNFFFYAAPGRYTVQIYGPAVFGQLVIPDVDLGGGNGAGAFSSLTVSGGVTSAGPNTLNGGGTLAGNYSATGANTEKNTNAVRYVNCVTNPQGWSGTDCGGYINSAYADLPSVGGRIHVANTSGCVNFTTAIVLSTSNKPVLLEGDPGATCLNWNSASGTAITMDWGVFEHANAGIRDIQLTGSGASSTAIGLSLGPTNGAEASVLSGFHIGTRAGLTDGFLTGITVGSNAFLSSIQNSEILNNGTGLSIPNGVEKINIGPGTVFSRNTTGLSATVAGTDISIYSVSFDDNTTGLALSGARATCHGCHFENVSVPAASAAYVVLTNSGEFLDYGSQMQDDQTTGTTAQFIQGNSGVCNVGLFGTLVNTSGRTLTQIVNFSGSSTCRGWLMPFYFSVNISSDFNQSYTAGPVFDYPMGTGIGVNNVAGFFGTALQFRNGSGFIASQGGNLYTLSIVNPASGRTLTLNDPGAAAAFLFDVGAQTLSSKTLVNPGLAASIGGNPFTFTVTNPASARTVNVGATDPGQTVSLPLTIVSGTKALNTASITTATCDAGVAATAPGTLSTDAVDWSFNAAPSATNKYGAFLVVYAVPSANTVTFYTCNPSATTSTPTAMTVNWSVRRP